VLNTFVFGMSIGYRFIDSASGSCNGNFVGEAAPCTRRGCVAGGIGWRNPPPPRPLSPAAHAGIGADCCQNASVQVDAADPWGISIVNGGCGGWGVKRPAGGRWATFRDSLPPPPSPCLCRAGEFTSFAGSFGPDVADHTQVVVSASNAGAVRFVSSAFWGPSNQIAKIAGSGSVGFDSCIFNNWDAIKQDRAAIQVSGGSVLVRGCEFQAAKNQVRGVKGGGGWAHCRSAPWAARDTRTPWPPHPTQILLNPGTNKAVITDNLIAGAAQIANNGAEVAVIQNNAPDA
jgi:hypothetical protein